MLLSWTKMCVENSREVGKNRVWRGELLTIRTIVVYRQAWCLHYHQRFNLVRMIPRRNGHQVFLLPICLPARICEPLQGDKPPEPWHHRKTGLPPPKQTPPLPFVSPAAWWHPWQQEVWEGGLARDCDRRGRMLSPDWTLSGRVAIAKPRHAGLGSHAGAFKAHN